MNHKSFIIILLVLPIIVFARQITVNSATQINGGSWSGGDTIIMKNIKLELKQKFVKNK